MKTFSEVLEMWWNCDKLNLREITLYHKRMTIDRHILPFFGDFDITDIDDIIITNFVTHEKMCGNLITGGPLCQNSIIKELGIVNGVIGYALKKRFIDDNPFDFIKALKHEPVKNFAIFTPVEVQSLIKVARPKWLGDMILLAYSTGLRKCECFGLQWENIDFTHMRLTVQRSVTAVKPGDRYITEPKTHSSHRVVLFDNATADMLLRRYKKRTSDIWVFADKYGNLLSPWYTAKYFGIARKKVGIHDKRFYDLRHTHITELVNGGIPLPVIQQRAGHTNINMTMHYVHISPDTQQGVVDMINGRKHGV